MAALAILAALYERERSGKGQYIDLAMLDGVISWMIMAGYYFARGRDPSDHELVLSGKYPCYTIYPTADGKYISIGCLEPWFWEELCRALGRDDLISQQFPPPQNAPQLIQQLTQIFRTKSRAEWFQLLRERDVCIAPVYTLSEMLSDPHTWERGMVLIQDHPKLGKIHQLGNPIKLSRTPPQIRSPAPALGEHTEQILAELGYTPDQIQQLRAQGVI